MRPIATAPPVILIATQICTTGFGVRIDPRDQLRRRVQGLPASICEMILTAGIKAMRKNRSRPGQGPPLMKTRRRGARRACGHRQLPPRRTSRPMPFIRGCHSSARPTADLDEIAAVLNKSEAITIYAGAGCAGAP